MKRSMCLNGDFKEVTKDSFLDEFLHLRKSNLVLIDRLSDEVLAFTGESNGMIFFGTRSYPHTGRASQTSYGYSG